MNVMEEIFEIRSSIEILANDIKVNTADEYMLISTIRLYSAIHVGICWKIIIMIGHNQSIHTRRRLMTAIQAWTVNA